MTASDWKDSLRARKVVLVKGKVRWFYHVVSANGKITETSQKYWSKPNAKRAAKKAAKLMGVELVLPV